MKVIIRDKSKFDPEKPVSFQNNFFEKIYLRNRHRWVISYRDGYGIGFCAHSGVYSSCDGCAYYVRKKCTAKPFSIGHVDLLEELINGIKDGKEVIIEEMENEDRR